MVTMSEQEYEVLEEKLNNPEKKVICPRCGNEIIYEKRGNSIAVECKTKGCIYGGIRGLYQPPVNMAGGIFMEKNRMKLYFEWRTAVEMAVVLYGILIVIITWLKVFEENGTYII